MKGTSSESNVTSALPNWRDVIDKARVRGGFTIDEEDAATELAAECFDKRIKLRGGSPKDAELRSWVDGFERSVYFNNFDMARIILEDIIVRHDELLAELDGGTNKEGSV